MNKFNNFEVKKVFDTYPNNVRKKMMCLRQLVLDTAQDIEEIKGIEETLKWGEPRSLSENRSRSEGKLDLGLFFDFLRRIAPLFAEKKRKIAQIQLFCNRLSILGQAPSYLTKSGSTIRMDWKKSNPEQYAMYFNCKTKLVDSFQEIYKDKFNFEGNRAIVFKIKDKVSVNELKHCISLSLTYHNIKHLPLLGV